jgi:hypothetical protein
VGTSGTDEVSMAIVGGSSSADLVAPPPSTGDGGAETTTGFVGAGTGGTAGHSPDWDIEPLVVGIWRILPHGAAVRDVPR